MGFSRQACLIIIVFCLLGSSLGRAVTLAPLPVTVIFPSRLSLSAKIMDMIRHDLEICLQRKVTLQIRLVKDTTMLPAWSAGTCLLLEKGFPKPPVTEGWRLTSQSLYLAWGLMVRKDILALTGEPVPKTRHDFVAQMQALKKIRPDAFPWFESLFSPHSLLYLRKALGPEKTLPLTPDYWIENGLMHFLQGSLDAHLLNPLSIEADEGLAFEVHEAGDAVFSTLWVPRYAFFDSAVCNDIIASSQIIPFPGLEHALSVPTVELRLWTREPGLQVKPTAKVATSTINFQPADACFDLEWIRTRFAPLYDRLIMGEY